MRCCCAVLWPAGCLAELRPELSDLLLRLAVPRLRRCFRPRRARSISCSSKSHFAAVLPLPLRFFTAGLVSSFKFQVKCNRRIVYDVTLSVHTKDVHIIFYHPSHVIFVCRLVTSTDISLFSFLVQHVKNVFLFENF